jgi:hypothetical protein
MPALGGQITIITSLTLASADAVGNKATASPVSIVFKPVNIMPSSGSTITITTPYNYFLARNAAPCSVADCSITCATACKFVSVNTVAVVNSVATIAGVAIVGTAGQFACSATNLAVGSLIIISGPLGGTGSIAGYVNPTEFKISAITGLGSSITGFTLTTTLGAAIGTSPGTPTGLIYSNPSRDSGTITVVTGGAPTTASAITLTLGANTLTTGTPQAGTSNGITVSTSQDFASAGATAAALGGQINIVASLTLAAADAVGNKVTASPVSIVFTAVNAVPSGKTIIITTPFNYFKDRSSGGCPTFNPALSPGVTFTGTTGTFTCTAGGANCDKLAVGVFLTFEGANGAGLGRITGYSSGPTAYKVSAMTPTLPATTYTLTTFDDLAIVTTAGAMTVSTSITITSPCAITCAVSCNGVSISTIAVVNTAAVGSTPGYGTITVVTGGAPTTASAITLTLGATILETVTPQAGTSNGITVSTSRDFASAGATAAALGGQINIVTSLTLAAADAVGNKVTASPVSIVFTAVIAVPSGGTITITTPFNYFVTKSATSCSGICSISCATPCNSVKIGSVAVVNRAAVGATPGYGEITVVTFGGDTNAAVITLTFGANTFTTGSPQPGVSDGIKVSTTRDYISAGASAFALGGQVTISTSLTLADEDLRGGWTTTSPVRIVFTSPSGIPVGSTITISTPYKYFASRGAAPAAAGSSITCAVACSVTVGIVAVVNTLASTLSEATGAVTVIVSGADITTANGAVTLSLGAGTLSTDVPLPGYLTGVSVSTVRDRSAPGPSQATNLAACSAIPTIAVSISNQFFLSAAAVVASMMAILMQWA